MTDHSAIDRLLDAAWARLDRVAVTDLAREHDAGALVVDIRPVEHRCRDVNRSSLAAATLRDLGLHRATDLIGGYQAWLRTRQPGTDT